MSASFTINFSDPNNTATIVVPSAIAGSGKNDYDTSLELIGAGYPNYGQAFAQNFLKLLENFASPYPPENAIIGQLWYDTSDNQRKVLRINNGNDTSSRWPTASGIFQQSNDPALEFVETLKEGDIWVDTNNSQLKIRYNGTWRLVGPSIGAGADKTGSEYVFLESTNTGTSYPVILNWSNGKVIEIISNNAFVPRRVIDGFTSIGTGTNLTNKNGARYIGISEKANALVLTSNTVLRATDFLRNRVTTQIHTGTLKVSSENGFSVINPIYNQELRLFADGNKAHISFNDITKPFQISNGSDTYVYIEPRYLNIGINKITTATSPTLDVAGGARFISTLTVDTPSSNAVLITGGVSIGKSISIGNNLQVSGITTASSTLTVGTVGGTGQIIKPAENDKFDIGSSASRFRRIYATTLGDPATTSTLIYGRLQGTATKLETKRIFTVTGHLSTLSGIKFDGSADVSLNVKLTKNAITDQVNTGTAEQFHTLLVVNTDSSATSADLESISKKDFLSDIYSNLVPSGSIIPWSTSSTATVVPNFLLCNGSIYDKTGTFSGLFTILGEAYNTGGESGTEFRIPDLMNVTTATGGKAIYYIIKT